MSTTESATAFLSHLQSSRLLTDQDFRSAASDSTSRDLPPTQFAVKLVRDGKLTPWQARQLLDGNPQSLVVSGYRLLEPLGRGSMGQVFKAVDEKRQRVVAIKMLVPELAADDDAVRRFQREARTTTTLRHPNIVRSFAAGDGDAAPFLVLEYLPGRTLADLIRSAGRLPPSDVARIARQVAAALEYAHDRGTVHRDIKPSNIRIQPDGTVKLLDLGLASFNVDAGSLQTSLTATGQIMGTVDYIAPEQARDGRLADARSDFYSLGCTMYHALTGQVPHPARSVAEKLTRHLFGSPVPMDELAPELPPPLVEVVRRLMSRDPGGRYQSGAELTRDLDEVSAGDPELSPETTSLLNDAPTCIESLSDRDIATAIDTAGNIRPPISPAGLSESTQTRRPAVTIVAAIIAIAAAGIWWTFQGNGPADNQSTAALATVTSPAGIAAPRTPIGTSDAIPSTAPIGDTADVPATPALPDLKREVQAHLERQASAADCAELRDALIDIYWSQRDTPVYLEAARLMQRLPWPADELDPAAISRSERESLGHGIPSLVSEKIVAVIGDSGMSHWQPPKDLSLIGNGDRIASSSYDGTVCIWNGESGRRLRLFTHSDEVMRVAVAPDERRLVCGTSKGELFVWDLDSGSCLIQQPDNDETTPNHRQINGIAWSTDGTRVVTGSLANSIRIRDTTTWEPIHTMHWESARAFRDEDFTGTTCLALAHDGTWLANSSRDGTVRVWDAIGGTLIRTVDLESPVLSVAISESGLLVAGTMDGRVAAWTDRGASRIWERRFDELNVRMIPALAFSPDGNDLAVARYNRLEVWHSATGAQRFVFDEEVSRIYAIRFVADSQTIVTSDHDNRIRRWDLATRTLVDNPSSRERKIRRVCCSPDGRMIAVSGDSGWLMMFDAATGRLTTMDRTFGRVAGFLAFSPDSQLLAATGMHDNRHELVVAESRSLSTIRWNVQSEGRETVYRNMRFSHDGTMLAVDRLSGDADGEFHKAGVDILDTDSGSVLHAFEQSRETGAFGWLSFSPNSSALYAARGTGHPIHWDLPTDERRSIVNKDDSDDLPMFSAFVCSPDGRSLGAIRRYYSPTRTVPMLIDAATHEVRHELRVVNASNTHEHCLDMAFSPDGRLVALAGMNGTISVWNVGADPPEPFGEPISVNAPFGGFHNIQFLPDGRHLLTLNSNKTACVVRLAPPGQNLP